MPGYGGGGIVLHLCRVVDERLYRCWEPRICIQQPHTTAMQIYVKVTNTDLNVNFFISSKWHNNLQKQQISK